MHSLLGVCKFFNAFINLDYYMSVTRFIVSLDAGDKQSRYSNSPWIPTLFLPLDDTHLILTLGRHPLYSSPCTIRVTNTICFACFVAIFSKVSQQQDQNLPPLLCLVDNLSFVFHLKPLFLWLSTNMSAAPASTSVVKEFLASGRGLPVCFSA